MNSQLRKRIEACTNEVDLVRIFRSMEMRSLRCRETKENALTPLPKRTVQIFIYFYERKRCSA